jgi:tetratricopeptide (TPR) repeat protein
LAIELCARAGSANWLSGLLSARADQGGLEALVSAPTRRLIVVDYAELRGDQLELLLEQLASHATPRYPVRVVLLVRTRPSGSGDWVGLLRGRSDQLDAVLDDIDTWALEDLQLDAAERQAVFAAAARALAVRADSARADAPGPPDALADGVFANPLMVVIAAYLAVHGQADLAMTRADLFDELLAHEQRYWRESALSARIAADEVLQRRVVALATLAGARSEARASELLRVIPDLLDAPAGLRRSLARWASRLYPPGDGFWGPLEPDLLGEHLIARTYTDDPAVLAGVLASDNAGALIRPLDVYTRAATDHPRLRANLAAILSDRLAGLCTLAAAQAATTTDLAMLLGDSTLATALERAAAVIPLSPDGLPDILNSLSRAPSLSLGPLTLTLITQLTDHLRRSAEIDPDRYNPMLAMSLNNQSTMLSGLGRREDALAAIEQAVAIRRELARVRPDAFVPNLATSLNNQSKMLSELGRREDALAAIDEALRSVVPTLELGRSYLLDTVSRLVQTYVTRCEDAQREPDADLVRRAHAALIAVRGTSR